MGHLCEETKKMRVRGTVSRRRSRANRSADTNVGAKAVGDDDDDAHLGAVVLLPRPARLAVGCGEEGSVAVGGVGEGETGVAAGARALVLARGGGLGARGGGPVEAGHEGGFLRILARGIHVAPRIAAPAGDGDGVGPLRDAVGLVPRRARLAVIRGEEGLVVPGRLGPDRVEPRIIAEARAVGAGAGRRGEHDRRDEHRRGGRIASHVWRASQESVRRAHSCGGTSGEGLDRASPPVLIT